MGSHKASKDMAEVTDSIGLDWDEIYFYIICFFLVNADESLDDVNVNGLRMRAWHCADVSCKLRPIALRVSKKKCFNLPLARQSIFGHSISANYKIIHKIVTLLTTQSQYDVVGALFRAAFCTQRAAVRLWLREKCYFDEKLLSNEDQIIFRSIEMAIKI